jgi:tetratricopeptide (TPR) repeat protein
MSPERANVSYEDKCINNLLDVIDFTLYAYDMRLTMSLYMILGSVYLYVNRPTESIKAYKLSRDIASELHDLTGKMEAYKEMGNSYSQKKDYINAIKCYKKLMIYAWKMRDKSNELNAYQGLAL